MSNPSRAEGTMFFPARFSTADEHLDWWGSVEVPDAVLQDVAESYSESRACTIKLMTGGGWHDIERDPSWSDAEYRERNHEAGIAFNERKQKIRDSIPDEIDRFQVRDAVRLHLAWRYAYTLPMEEQEKLESQTVHVGDLSGTLPAFSRHFAMDGYAYNHPTAFTRLPDNNAELDQRLADLARGIQQTHHAASEAQRLAAADYRATLIEHGVNPDRAEQMIAGVPVTAKRTSQRTSNKMWRRQS